MKPERSPSRAVVASVTMGYGHLRAAHPIAEELGVEVVAIDAPPVAEPGESVLWASVRRVHELLSKPMPFLGPFDRPARGLMNALTMIPPLHERRDHRAPTWSVRLLDALIRGGLGRGMLSQLRHLQAPFITTFYAPAIIADQAGLEDVYCVVTDADCNRVWAPLDPSRTRIKYCAPTARVVRRLRSFGVPEENIFLTGFPLPPLLTERSADEAPESRLLGRIARLDPRGVFQQLHAQELSWLQAARRGGEPSHGASVRDGSPIRGDGASPWRGPPPATPEPVRLMFAVGGAGAQAEMADEFLPSLRPLIVDGRVRLELAYGTRTEVRRAFLDSLRRAALEHQLDRGVVLNGADDFEAYYRSFNRSLLSTDVLWTKPSELSFYPALGLACVLARPVGAHERYNRRWLREQGVGLKQRRRDHTAGWLEEWLEDGTLAAAAWSGFVRLPKHGTQNIAELVRAGRQRPLQLETAGAARAGAPNGGAPNGGAGATSQPSPPAAADARRQLRAPGRS